MPETHLTPIRRVYHTPTGLPYDARMRLDHAGKIIAWDQEMTRVVGVGDRLETVCAAARSAGVADPVLEWVPPVPVQALDEAP